MKEQGPQPLPHGHPDYWRREVIVCLFDGHPDAARAALAQWHLGDLSASPARAQVERPEAWAAFERDRLNLIDTSVARSPQP